MKSLNILFVLTLSFVLAACGSNSAILASPTETQPVSAPPTQISLPPTDVPDVQPSQVAGNAEYQLPELTDSQGAVAVIVKPLDLGSQAEKLTFEVALETHSVDLSMDLAALATLTTDTGLTVQADVWDAPRGGHHVSGTLSFPSSLDGKTILDGATTLTLTIKDVDAPERTFAWDLK
jgi:hypothetical protein